MKYFTRKNYFNLSLTILYSNQCDFNCTLIMRLNGHVKKSRLKKKSKSQPTSGKPVHEKLIPLNSTFILENWGTGVCRGIRDFLAEAVQMCTHNVHFEHKCYFFFSNGIFIFFSEEKKKKFCILHGQIFVMNKIPIKTRDGKSVHKKY